MTSPVSWPAGVPDRIRREGYQYQPPNRLIESEMERGHKLRPVATGTPEIHKCPIRMTWAEFALFETYCSPTGPNPSLSLPFMFPHPRTRVAKRAQIIPEGGRPYLVAPHKGRHWIVTLNLRIYP